MKMESGRWATTANTKRDRANARLSGPGNSVRRQAAQRFVTRLIIRVVGLVPVMLELSRFLEDQQSFEVARDAANDAEAAQPVEAGIEQG